MKNMFVSKKIFFPIILVFVLIGFGVFAYRIKGKKSEANTKNSTITDVVPSENSDLKAPSATETKEIVSTEAKSPEINSKIAQSTENKTKKKTAIRENVVLNNSAVVITRPLTSCNTTISQRKIIRYSAAPVSNISDYSPTAYYNYYSNLIAEYTNMLDQAKQKEISSKINSENYQALWLQSTEGTIIDGYRIPDIAMENTNYEYCLSITDAQERVIGYQKVIDNAKIELAKYQALIK